MESLVDRPLDGDSCNITDFWINLRTTLIMAPTTLGIILYLLPKTRKYNNAKNNNSYKLTFFDQLMTLTLVVLFIHNLYQRVRRGNFVFKNNVLHIQNFVFPEYTTFPILFFVIHNL